MKKTNKIALLCIMLGASVFLLSFVQQAGKSFPLLTGESLENKKVTIPTDTKGKFTLVGLAYSQKAQDDLETWLQPAYTNFIEKPAQPGIFDDSYDVHVYFVPMFTGANEVAAGPAKKKLQNGLDKDLKPHLLIYKGDISKYKSELALNDKEKPYFFVLDPQGKIVHTESGPYSEKKMEKIESFLE